VTITSDLSTTLPGRASGTPPTLGDPFPWFSARDLSARPIDLHVDAGRWIVIAFLGAPDTAPARQAIEALIAERALLREDHLVAYCVLTSPPGDVAAFERMSSPALSFLADYDGALTRAYGAAEMPRFFVLDPMMRAIANVAADHPQGWMAILQNLLRGLPSVDDSAGVPLTAPALIVPRVLNFELCDLLVQLYDKVGGEDSGFLLDQNGKTMTVLDYKLKRRHDLLIALPELRDQIRRKIVDRLLPPIERYFQFAATRMDRYLVSCYDSAIGGHFFRHRDNLNAGAQHRRFAVSINLNGDYDGCDLIFPEFGRRVYRAPVGGAIVFSCGALHQVTPVTRGRRYAFLPFLYGENDAALREANNTRLHEGETHYVAGADRLFPAEAAE